MTLLEKRELFCCKTIRSVAVVQVRVFDKTEIKVYIIGGFNMMKLSGEIRMLRSGHNLIRLFTCLLVITHITQSMQM